MVALETALLAVVVGALVVVLGLLWQVQAAVERDGDEGVDSDALESALHRTFSDMEFQQTVTRIEDHAGDMAEFHGDIERMLRSPRERGEFGEQQLDVLLGDHLPPDMYGLREQVVDGKTPDAHVKSSSGVIAIDSKFPLDNYEKFTQAEDEEARERFRRKFRLDVEQQLEKIADDYVRPDAGTTEFAFAFVPSESVYYHLVTAEYDLLREYAGEGVQVVSPLTFGQKLELIKADVQARKLSEEAAEIRERLVRLSGRFEAFADEWETLRRHVRNASNKAEDVDSSFRSLRTEFDRVEEPSLVDAGDDD
jgi:DNA recombination protein RmuC